MQAWTRSTRWHRYWLHGAAAVLTTALLLAGSLVTAPPAMGQANDIQFSEIFYNPAGQAEGHEFFELHNQGDQVVDLSAWVVSGDVDLTFPTGTTIGPGGYLVATADASAFSAEWAAVADAEFSGRLANSGSTITLQNQAGVIVDQAGWDDVEPWPTSADGAGDSLGRLTATPDGVSPESWVAATPTPGSTNRLTATVLFSVGRGWYSDSQTVTLTSSVPNATIFYTTNGSGDPTTEYTGPLTVNDDRDVRVIQAAVRVDGQEGVVTTHSYVFEADNGIPRVIIWQNSLNDAPGEDESTRHFEFIPPPSTGLAAVGADVGFKASTGGVSAGRSDKIFFRAAYGTGTLRADLFSDFYYGRTPVQKIDQLFLRDRHLDPSEAKQMIAHDSLNAVGQLSPHGRYVRMWEAGISKGVRYLHERPEGGFMETYTGIDKSLWQAESGGIPRTPGTTWTAIERDWNIESLIDFSLVQWQANVWDYWPDRNYRVAGPTAIGDGADYRFHFFNWDLDHGYTGALPYRWAGTPFQTPEDMIEELDPHVQFGLQFQDRVACAFSDGGALTAQSTQPRLQARFDELRAAGGPSNSVSQWTDWIADRNVALLEALRDRSDPLLGNRDPVTVQVNEGILSITGADGFPVWYRQDGGDVRSPTGQLSPNAVAYTGPVALAAGRHRIVARSFDQAEPRAVDKWSPACNDVAAVDVAVAGNVAVSPGDGLVINEVHYNPPTLGVDDGDLYEFVELFNSTSQAINVSEFSFSAGVNWTARPGETIDAGQHFVIASDAASFTSRYGQAPDDVYDGRLNDAGELLALTDATGVTVDQLTYSDLTPWPVLPDGQGPSLSLIDPALDNTLAPNWAASSQDFGTPFVANEVVQPTPTGDVSCDATTTAGDVQLILDYHLGMRMDSGSCPVSAGSDRVHAAAGDLNGDTLTDVFDALQLAQCIAGMNNDFCPA